MIEIISKREGFRRAGVAHSIAPRQYPDDAFSSAELKELKAEAMLTVRIVKDTDKDKAAVKKAESAKKADIWDRDK